MVKNLLFFCVAYVNFMILASFIVNYVDQLPCDVTFKCKQYARAELQAKGKMKTNILLANLLFSHCVYVFGANAELFANVLVSLNKSQIVKLGHY